MFSRGKEKAHGVGYCLKIILMKPILVMYGSLRVLKTLSCISFFNN